MGGAVLTTPKVSCNGSEDDFIEAINHVLSNYKPPKTYALGGSKGGSVLARILGKVHIKFDACVSFQCGIKFEEI
jgi:predicted alpha/beta-fold hydrolase